MSKFLMYLHLKEGSLHWWLQRLSSVFLFVLFLWLDFSVFLLLIVVLLYHIRAGIETLIEDYLHSDSVKIFFFVVLRLLIIYVVKITAIFFLI
uniref:Succinate dehydrogenase subunit 4 n=1 Tax=Palpitomonas bilix TaxID=652834 RepID=A0A1E1GHN8_9EUKA|nr:succinate dehydrogenase subunit 4 [Palpitomonas bilix]YP_009317271.1 succinate dehydrogenase subunit 4 [Palpitomonas bilix]BAV82382.1 succinate dehydrogenase subunit 4 [Palpitomonas bilix]BAV82439.1 succinate dehydrogenase subunit 4 [Palpitomonas bilix]